jgi:pilus assembly protein Flp/PilA
MKGSNLDGSLPPTPESLGSATPKSGYAFCGLFSTPSARTDGEVQPFAGVAPDRWRRKPLNSLRKETDVTDVTEVVLSTLRRDEGQALVEYALIISLIAIVSVAALTLAGIRVDSLISAVANNL